MIEAAHIGSITGSKRIPAMKTLRYSRRGVLRCPGPVSLSTSRPPALVHQELRCAWKAGLTGKTWRSINRWVRTKRDFQDIIGQEVVEAWETRGLSVLREMRIIVPFRSAPHLAEKQGRPDVTIGAWKKHQSASCC